MTPAQRKVPVTLAFSATPAIASENGGSPTDANMDFPMPLTVQVERPAQKPDSRGPDYQKYWGVPGPNAPALAVKSAEQTAKAAARPAPKSAPKGRKN